MNKPEAFQEFTRRDFIKGGSFASLMMLMGAVEIRPQEKPADKPTEYKVRLDPVPCAVIGCGAWGREILSTLAKVPTAPIVAICDNYAAYLKRGKALAPNAQTVDDYRKVLAMPEVKAVIVATPSHLHRQIVVEAIKAGKHVYCEAPLATTVEDAREISKAAQAAPHINFQAGLQNRSDVQIRNLEQFIRTGAMGRTIKGRGQWNKKMQWRRTSPNPDREKELNWRLDEKVSLGVVGEIGIHQLDVASWFLMNRPLAVTGFGSVIQWTEDRKQPDSVDVVLEYPGGVRYSYACTLANSFDAEYDVYYGTFSAILMRERRAWMFKEVDSPLLGWEVYARKESFYKETGIVLGANATKLTAQGDNPALDASAVDEKTALQHAFESFVVNSNIVTSGVEDFSQLFDASDKAALKEYIDGIKGTFRPAANAQIGYEAAVIAIKASEAIRTGKRVEFDKDIFEVS